MTDPWSVQSTNEKRQTNSGKESDNILQHNIDFEKDIEPPFGFEDSFIQDKNSNTLEYTSEDEVVTKQQHLPDSEVYLQGLERKLEKLKKSSKLVDALSEKREDCLRSMLQNNSNSACNNDLLLELESSVSNSDSAVQNLYRQLQPVQPVTVGETVHIVKYDQLEEQCVEEEKEQLDLSFRR